MKPPGLRRETLTAASDALAAWWQRRRELVLCLGDLFYRLFLIIGYAWVGIEMRLPIIDTYLPLKNVLVCLAAVILTGKTIFDTFFYSRFRL